MVVSEVVGRLEGLDVGSLDLGGVSRTLRDVARLEGFVAGLKTRLAQRADQLAVGGSGVPADELLGRDRTTSRRRSQREVERARTMDRLPAMADLLSEGRVGVEHADAVVAAATGLPGTSRDELFSLDAELAQAAAAQSPEGFRRHLRRVVDRIAADDRDRRAERQREAATLTKGIDEVTGMYWLRAELPPEDGHRLFRAIDAEVTQLRSTPEHEGRRPGHVAATALVGLVARRRGTSATAIAPQPPTAEALVLIDLQTMLSGLHDRSICELGDGTAIPVATARRLACDAGIIPVVLSGEGVALDVGRSRRQATADQRRALRAMYRTCAIDRCDGASDACEIHHLLEWTADLGPTDLDNLLPLCVRHHHLAHEGRWRLELDPRTRHLTVRLPDGTLHSRSRPDLAAERARRAA